MVAPTDPRVISDTVRQSWRDVFAQVRARPEEIRWTAIPWQTDLWQARRLAREQGKPIFLWAMNGNPLGCT